MKKTLIIIALVLLTSALLPAKNFTLTLYGNYFSVGDANYKDLYGSGKMFPEGKFSLRIKGNIFLWGSVGYLPSNFTWDEWSNKGLVDPDIEGKNASNKLFYSGGAGYYVGYMAKGQFAVKLEVGVCSTAHNIEISATDTGSNQKLSSNKTSSWGIGMTGNLGVTYGLMNNIYAEANIGYMYVWDKEEDETVNAGGLRLALGIGLKF